MIPQLFMRTEGVGSTEFNEQIVLIELISLKNDNQTSASFFLGCGSINEMEYYVYFQQFEDGGVKRGMIRVKDAVIYERDEQPHLEWTEVDKKCHWLGRLGFDWADIKKGQRKGDYRIIVPKNTIIERFEIK